MREIKRPLMVHWSDQRSDEISIGNYKRKRIDDLLHHLLEISNENNCLELIKSIPHEKIMNTIETCTNEQLKSARQTFLSKQFTLLINKVTEGNGNDHVTSKSQSLFSHILDFLVLNYKNIINTSEFVIYVTNIVIKFPFYFQNCEFFDKFMNVVSNDHLIEITNNTFDRLKEKNINNQDLKNLLRLVNLSLDEISKRTFQASQTLVCSFEWLKLNFEQIFVNYECREIIYKLIQHLFSVMPSVTFSNLLNLYLESENLFVIYLALSVTKSTLKIDRDNYETENFLKLYQAISKLVNILDLNEESENIGLSLEMLIKFLISSNNVVQEIPELKKTFYEKSFTDLLVRALRKLKKVEINKMILNFILNSISTDGCYSHKEEDEIIQTIVEDPNTFGVLLNHENLLLLLNLLKRDQKIVEEFLCNIINHIEKNEEITYKCFESLLKCLGQLSEELRQLILNKLREHIGFFIELLEKNEFKKTSIKFLEKLLNFSDEEKRMVDSYYGLNEMNKALHEEKIEAKEDFLFFTTENFENIKKTTIKNELDKISQASISESIKLLGENLKALKEKNYYKIKPFKNTEEFEKIKNSLNFVWTETTRSNLNKILQAEVSPILLEGGTGIGKSATIQVASDITKNTLIRFNMSSRVTIDDLLAKVAIIKDINTSSDTFEFQLSPFAVAFEEGHWLLLDEMNLAPDNVLQCIENALDSRTLILHNPCDSVKPVKIINMHPNFRLFATQNPSVGFFKGKREKLSQSLLDRFTIYYFDDLPIIELVEIAKNQLSSAFPPEEASKLSEKIVREIHMNIKSKIDEKEFPEKAAYAEITIRDLFKLCERFVSLKDKKCYNKDNSNKFLSFFVFLTYASRFRNNGRIDIMKKTGLPSPALDVNDKYEISVEKVEFEDIFLKNYRALEYTLRSDVSRNDPRFLYLSHISSVHEKIEKLCLSKKFIAEHGLYLIDNSWIAEWFDQLQNNDKKYWDKIGFKIYASRFRHESVRINVKTIFNTEFNNSEFDLNEINENISKTSFRPFVVTERVLKIWKQIGWNLDSSYPILLTGNEGCGKSETIYAFAKLIGMDITQVCMTPETEASHLVGQYNPNDGTGEKIKWQDGFITRAFKKGISILLDNLNQGDSCVLERLNPLLENEPIWVLTENRETLPLKKQENFKVFATMTVSSNSNNKSFYPELSPALYNRFSIIHMENNSWNDEIYFKSEISSIMRCFLDIKKSSENYANIVSNILWLIHKEINLNDRKSEYGVITLRNYIRFIDMFYKLSIKVSDKNIKPELILFKCYKICFEGQFKFKMQDDKVPKKSQLYFTIQKELQIMAKDDFYLKDNYKFDEAYVLTESRTEFVETVLACIECNIPVLLEGKTEHSSENLLK